MFLTSNFFVIWALKGLELGGQEHELLKLIQKETQDGKLDNVVSKAAKALKSTSEKSICSSKWLKVKGVLHFQGKIFVLPSSDIC